MRERLPGERVQWRVTVHHRTFVDEIRVPNEEHARERAELEREDYPHAEIKVERRYVTPWEAVVDR